MILTVHEKLVIANGKAVNCIDLRVSPSGKMADILKQANVVLPLLFGGTKMISKTFFTSIVCDYVYHLQYMYCCPLVYTEVAAMCLVAGVVVGGGGGGEVERRTGPPLEDDVATAGSRNSFAEGKGEHLLLCQIYQRKGGGEGGC